ncbi:Putative Phage tail collar domain protein [Avibacterium paragallinarum JF4211]|uniref:Phage tail collar domain-containing protein n=4 Tax=Avibacterium paragallinarum TaxID=728 RepID=A0A377I5Y8_AVIPA|nr:tail fiber protein [Avibacterium paragallinarum]CDF99217.1 Putative Phage tail collar domain protein [Avibacterium paragallinarum JF4211]STO70232.1 phage tail collar domain-containing protein [Avibacterium paragallinarum]
MANLEEQEKWETGIYQIEENDPVHGGADGVTNKPIKQLANRTKYLKKEVERRYVEQAATTAQTGTVKLNSSDNSDSETEAATPKVVKKLKGLIDALTCNLGNYIPNSKKSNAINSASSDTVATSNAVKTAYDKGVEAKNRADSAYTLAQSKQSPATTLAGYGIKDFKVQANLGTQDLNQLTTVGIYGQVHDSLATSVRHYPEARAGALTVKPSAYGVMQEYVTHDKQIYYARNRRSGGGWSEWVRVGGDSLPVGAVLAFPRAITHPQGFLLADGSTFGSSTYPDLYRALGNSNKLPDLRRSDVGMTAYFATDNIPEGWIAFDDIEEQVSEQAYPELYRHLVAKYGSLSAVPKAKDRFIRNAGALLAVGEVQQDALQDHFHYIPTEAGGDYQAEKGITIVIHDSDTTNVVPGAFKPAQKGRVQANNVAVADGARAKTYLASTKDTTEKDTRTAEETRPKSLVLKLCIKAQNTLDGVQFWIKAFGEIANAGQLDASRLAQDIQEVKAKKADVLHTHTASDITDFDTGVDNRIAQLFTYQKIGDFEVRKYPDGTMIQTYTIRQNDLYEWFEKSFNWAIAFVDTPLIFSKVTTSIGGSHNAGVNILTKSNNATCYYHEYEHGGSNQGNVRIQFLAIGRWK